MNIQTKNDIHQEVEYIKQDTEFPFDTHDELEEMLKYYKLNTPRDPELRKIIESEIRAIAEQHQTAEIVHSINTEPDDITETEHSDKKQTDANLTPEQQNIRNYINTARETLHQHKVNKAIQQANETKPPQKTPTITKVTNWPTLAKQDTNTPPTWKDDKKERYETSKND